VPQELSERERKFITRLRRGGKFYVLLREIRYLFHRWMHVNKYLWRIHEAHHSTPDVDWVGGSRGHVIENMITGTAELAPIVLFMSHVAAIKSVIDACWGMWIHSNIDWAMGKLKYVINGPFMHRWHHAREIHDVNFATKFAFWDWLLGTAYLPDRKPGELRAGRELAAEHRRTAGIRLPEVPAQGRAPAPWSEGSSQAAPGRSGVRGSGRGVQAPPAGPAGLRRRAGHRGIARAQGGCTVTVTVVSPAPAKRMSAPCVGMTSSTSG
jgi:hypothetical protein